METMHQPGAQQRVAEDKAASSMYTSLQRLRTLFSLILLTFSLVMGQIMLQLALASDNSSEPSVVQGSTIPEVSSDYVLPPLDDNQLPAHRSLFANIPQVSRAAQLSTPNYSEDRAMREAILARLTQWQVDACSLTPYYKASNTLQVYMGNPHCPQPAATAWAAIRSQRDHTLLTARILLGLWYSRRDDSRFSFNGSAAVLTDEILHWRGVQKHQRIAYPGASKRFSDGYQWKHKQQVVEDLYLLQQYYLLGYHTVVSQGKTIQVPVDSPYLYITPIGETGYFVAPGNWFTSYTQHDNNFAMTLDRRIFQLHPHNDRLALRMALYLTEHWRLYARNGRYQQPLLMTNLLAASMIPIDKANLTSRFAPGIEAALQKLYALGILAEPPTCVTSIDKSKAQWGKDWLASYWTLLPPTAQASVSFRAYAGSSSSPAGNTTSS